MKSLRLTEVLLPLLAARGWAPWPVEPGVRQERRRPEVPPLHRRRAGAIVERRRPSLR